ncbi:2105_t:CDS:1, partial [Gigaspora margarita]
KKNRNLENKKKELQAQVDDLTEERDQLQTKLENTTKSLHDLQDENKQLREQLAQSDFHKETQDQEENDTID